MTPVDSCWASVAELSHAFGARETSPVHTVDALLERIRRRNPGLHAYIAVYEDDARLAADAADRAIRARHRVGPLHGVPIALKDLVDLEGRITTGGSKIWAERVSPVTSLETEEGAFTEGKYVWSVTPLSLKGEELKGGRMNKLESSSVRTLSLATGA